MGAKRKRRKRGRPTAVYDPHRRLAAAIVLRAVRDARSSNGYAAEARRWLLSDPLAADLLDYLDLGQSKLTAWVEGLEPLRQPALP
jgi:hypothetical protein